MGDHRARWSPNSSPAPARAATRARSSRSATRSNRSSRSRARRRASSTQMRAQLRAAYADAGELEFRADRVPALVPLGAGRARRGRHRVRQPAAFRGLTADAGVRPRTALPRRAPGLVEIWPLIKPEEARRVEGWDAPFDDDHRDEPAGAAGAPDRARAASWIAQAIRSATARAPRGAGRHPGAGAPARRRCSRRSSARSRTPASRSPAPTGWC